MLRLRWLSPTLLNSPRGRGLALVSLLALTGANAPACGGSQAQAPAEAEPATKATEQTPSDVVEPEPVAEVAEPPAPVDPWGPISADELLDTTLDRVARKLEEGAVIQKGSLGAYMRGVARLVFYESTRKPRTEVLVHDVAEGAQEEGLEPSLACLDRCLQTLDPGERRLALEYYENGDKAAIRRTLAHALGLSATALRIRAHRLRERLENCVSNCLGATIPRKA